MTVENEFTITIHLNNGNPIKYKAKLSDAELATKADDIEYMLNRFALATEVDKRLLIIPYNNIKYIEVFPAPPNLPLFIIKDGISIP
ncbi:MAG: hypothetical protein HW386_2549 [Gammaproteobacteria bacterium]|nr:hypothetical protein [Gammaproteobacteria bacterium]